MTLFTETGSFPLYVTAIYTSLISMFLVKLSLNIVRLRYKHRVSLLDGGNDKLKRAVRIHGNFCEHVPFILILMTINELAGLAHIWLHIAGVVLIISRMLHMVGLKKNILKLRQYGVISMWSLLISLPLLVLMRIFIF